LSKTKEEIGSKLSSIKNRNGNGKLRFTDYKFRNENNEIITEVISGEYLKIEIDFDLYKKVNFQKLIIVLNIQDNFEKAIISFVTDEMGIKFNDPIDNKLIIEIPKLLLRGGQYTARLLAMQGDTQKESFLDELEHAFYINVLSSDYWNSGTTLRNGESAYIDGEMKIT
jgi:hypothetical protein